MENVQVSTHYTHVPDPKSLQGLDDLLSGLLDRIFDDNDLALSSLCAYRQSDSRIDSSSATDLDELFGKGEIIDFSPGIIAASIPSEDDDRQSLFSADPDYLREWELRTRLLEAQIDFRNEELKRSLDRIRFLETQMTAKDDQLRMLPELLKRGIDATRYQAELSELKDNLEYLLADLKTAQD
ncbi:MAG: hypothetical protein K8F91_27355, partial [Candidatus Obscuribacterales bacterium]|nr:hypothetical protein [Candidatus Obscuribacterales bacterium]